MSYCRMSEGDVYMYPSVYGGIECCGCRLEKCEHTVFFKRTDALKHLKEHRLQGHVVPQHAFDRLERELTEYGDTGGIEPLKSG